MPDGTSDGIRRRRFLDYVLYTTAAVTIGLGSYYFYNRLAKPVVTTVVPDYRTTTEPSRHQTSVTMTTTTKRSKVRFWGKVFHDLNGNGVQDANEPSIDGVRVGLRSVDTEEEYSATTDSDGGYEISSLPTGEYILSVSGHYPEKDFKYWSHDSTICQNYPDGREWTKLLIDDDTEYELPLMIGPFTVPFKRGTKYDLISFYDVDRRDRTIRDWKGGQETYDQHDGTDFAVKGNTPVLAAAPGIVQYVEDGWSKLSSEVQKTKQGGNYVVLRHVTQVLSYFDTGYFHLRDGVQVRMGQTVSRGEVIAHSGDTGINPLTGQPVPPHLHLQLIPYYAVGAFEGVDFYRDVRDPSSKCFWTKDNDPQFAL